VSALELLATLPLVAFFGWLAFAPAESDRLLQVERAWEPRSPDECPRNTRTGRAR
jgi:hypothetical protein